MNGERQDTGAQAPRLAQGQEFGHCDCEWCRYWLLQTRPKGQGRKLVRPIRSVSTGGFGQAARTALNNIGQGIGLGVGFLLGQKLVEFL